MAFSNDGTKMFVVGGIGRDINEYALSTAYFDASTATFVDATSVSSHRTRRAWRSQTTAAKMFIVAPRRR